MADLTFEAPLDVIRYFVDRTEASSDSPIVADIAIGAFGRDLLRWADHQTALHGAVPSAEQIAVYVRNTPPSRYDDMLRQAHQVFAAAANDLLYDDIEEAREQGDDGRLQAAASAARLVLADHESGRFDRLFATADQLAEDRARQSAFASRLERFGASVLNGVLVTLVVALIAIVALAILGGGTGLRALLSSVLNATAR